LQSGSPPHIREQIDMTHTAIRNAVAAYLAKGGAVKRGPTLYADGCRASRDAIRLTALS
jgi:hypothetical protein